MVYLEGGSELGDNSPQFTIPSILRNGTCLVNILLIKAAKLKCLRAYAANCDGFYRMM